PVVFAPFTASCNFSVAALSVAPLALAGAPGVAGAELTGSLPMTLFVYSRMRERVRMKLVARNIRAQIEVVLVRKLLGPLLPKILWLELPNPMPPSAFP